jgi:Beta-lactamase associated winged helix domain
VQAVTESIYHGVNPALLPAAHETVRAHLEKLRREGRAFVEDGQWSADVAP